MSINRVNISGNLTRDPEMRATQGGTQILTFGVAVNDRRRNPQTGEWEDYPNFIDCVVFGNRAEPLSRFLTKGMKVAVEGKLRWSQWERDGQKRSKIEVIVDEVEFLSSRQGQGQGQGGYQPQGSHQPQQRQQLPAPPPQGRGRGEGGSQPQGSYQPQQRQQMPAPAPTYAAPQPQPTYQPQPAVQTPPPAEVYDEDIPF